MTADSYRTNTKYDTLMFSGCGSTQFATCSGVAISCTSNTCSDSEYFCYLSNQCHFFNQSCTCNSESSVATAVTSCNNLGTKPQYTVVGQTQITISQPGEKFYTVPAGDIPILEHDIIGIQLPQNEKVLKCEDVPTGPTQQTVYKASHTGWLEKNDFFPTTTTTENMTCYFQALYTQDSKQYFPQNLAFSSTTGDYDLSISIVEADSHNVSVLLEESVADIAWVYPVIIVGSTGTNTLGTVYTEWNKAYNFTVSVDRGTNLDSVWSFDNTKTVSLTDTCVTAVTTLVPEQCNASLYWSENPFATFEYNSTTTGTSTLSVNFTNILGKTEKLLTIQTEKAISGISFSLSSASRITNNVAFHSVSQFDTTILEGTGVTYTFFVDSVPATTTNSTLFYTFTAKKTYNVEAFVTNIIGSQSQSLSVYAKQAANFQGCEFHNTPYIAAVGIPLELDYRCGASLGTEVQAIWMLSDRSVNITSAITTTSTLTQIWKEPITFSTVQIGVQVTAFAADPFEEHGTSATVEVYNAIPSVDLIVSSYQVFPSTSIDFTASIPSSPGSYGDVVYTVAYGDGSSLVASVNGSVSHSFASKGNYSVTVTASNGPSSQSVTKYIEVYDSVKDLTLSYNGPKTINQPVAFTATVTEGNFLTYSFLSSDFNITQSSGVFNHMFTSAADYEVTVVCYNALSELNTSIIAYIMNPTDIRLSNIKIDGNQSNGCLETGENYNFSVDLIHYDSTAVLYDWDFSTAGTALPAVSDAVQSFGYLSAGNYTVTVTAKYASTVSEVTQTLEVCVEEAIVTPTILITSPLGLPPSGPLTKNVSVSVLNGSNLQYTWFTNATAGGETNDAMFSVTFASEGWYVITVTVSNNINTVTTTTSVEIVSEVSGLIISCASCKSKAGELYVESGVMYEFAVAISSGTGVTYSWDYGDTNTAVGSATNYTYSTVGLYNLTVTASNPVSASFDQSIVIHVEVPLTQVTLATHLYHWKNGINSLGGTKVLDILNTAVLIAEVQPTSMDIIYEWVFNTGLTPISNTTNVGYHNYTTTGKKECVITASNMINSITSDILEFYIIEQITDVNLTENGNILSSSFNYIVSVNQDYTFTAISSQAVPETIDYLFILKETTQLIASTLNSTFTQSFSKETTFTLTLSLDYKVQKYEATYTIEAIKPISGAYISTPPGTNGNITFGSSFTLTVQALEGKYPQYSWYYAVAPPGETISGQTNSSDLTITPGSVGEYVITAEIYNSVSPAQSVNYTMNVMYGVAGVAIDVTLPFPNAVKQGTTLDFTGSVTMGTDLTYSWTAEHSGIESTVLGQIFSMTFTSQALYNITLNVDNFASSGIAFEEIYSLFEIPNFNMSLTGGVYLNNIAKFVAITGNNLTMTSSMTNTDFIDFDWQVNGTSSSVASFFQTAFPMPSLYLVRLEASNLISQDNNELMVIIQDAITGLTVQFCQSTFEVSTSVTLMANTAMGTDVSYKWEGSGLSSTTSNIHIVNFQTVGIYDINVTALNYVSEQTEYCVLTILGRITNLALNQSQYSFTMYPITFTVDGDYIDPANFTWVFSHGYTQVTTDPFLDVSLNQGTYSVTVTVSNAVSNDTVTMSFDVEDLVCNVPTLTVDGSTERTTFRARPVELAVSVFTGGCTNYTSVNKWSVYPVASCADPLVNEYLLGSEIETSTPVLQLPGAFLDYGTYCVTFTHRYANTPVEETRNFSLTIEASDLKALINGGDEISAVEGSTLTLDATESYDPDNATGTVLTYTWSCTQSMVCVYI